MAIIRGSMKHTFSGRKRKQISKAKQIQKVQFYTLNREEPVRRETKQYPSAPMTPYKPAKDETYKQEISAEYTIAPAYNKGAYQVIAKDDIVNIGK